MYKIIYHIYLKELTVKTSVALYCAEKGAFIYNMSHIVIYCRQVYDKFMQVVYSRFACNSGSY